MIADLTKKNLELPSARAISLWDMMQFFLGDTCQRWIEIQTTAKQYEIAASNPNQPRLQPSEFRHLAKIIRDFEFISQGLHLKETAYQTGLVRESTEHEPQTHLSVSTLLRNLLITATKEINGKVVAFIPDEKAEYFEKDSSDALFGFDVFHHFPDAWDDIKEAGNCIAAGLNTAAVFHLMRTVEHGMRALGRHLDIKIKNRTLESADWSQLIRAIREKIQDRQAKYEKSKKKRKGEFEALRFYTAITDEMNVFRENWRNNTMHTRSHYKATEAIAVFDRVRDFMQRLSTKVTGLYPATI